MSSTGRNAQMMLPKLKDDFYQTPPWAFEWFEKALLRAVPRARSGESGPSRILEPGAGVGGLVGEMHRLWPDASIVAVEKRPDCQDMLYAAGAEHVVIGDFENEVVQNQVEGLGPYDLILGNPPYGGAKWISKGVKNPNYGLWLRFVKIGLRMLNRSLDPDWRAKLIFLLRCGALETDERNSWMVRHVPDAYILPKRPKFTGTGSDSATYAWLAWEKDERFQGHLEVLKILGKIDKHTKRTIR